MSTDISSLTPEALAQHLLTTGSTLEDLVEHFAADAKLLTTLLHSHEYHDHQKLRIDLALAQARLQAAACLPACIAKLQALTNADKPEVARRAVMALLGIAGLSTRVAPTPAPPPTPTPDPPEPPAPAPTTDPYPATPEAHSRRHPESGTPDADAYDDFTGPDPDPKLEEIRQIDYDAYQIAFERVGELEEARDAAADRAEELALQLARAKQKLRALPTQPSHPIRPHWPPPSALPARPNMTQNPNNSSLSAPPASTSRQTSSQPLAPHAAAP